MKSFILGFVTGGLLLALCVLGYLNLGLVEVGADAPTPSWVARWLSRSVHASIRRSVPRELNSPLLESDETLIAGGELI